MARRQGCDHVLPDRGAGQRILLVGNTHAAQGDPELCGTAIEMSLTGTFQLILHKRNTLTGSLAGLNYPLLETQDKWVLHGFSFANYLEELGPTAQQDIYKKSSIDLALRDAFRKMRSFLMTTKGLSEDNVRRLRLKSSSVSTRGD